MSKDPNHLFHEINNLSTEQRNKKSIDIDFASTAKMLKIENNEDKTIPLAIEKELPYNEKAEDFEENVAKDVLEAKANSNGVVCGIAASMRTPHVKGAKIIVMTITGVDCEEANYHVKSTLVIILADVGYKEAKSRLEKADGFVRRVIDQRK